MEFTLNVCFADGTMVSSPCKTQTNSIGITAVYTAYIGKKVIDANYGGNILIALENIDTYMADNRYSEFWCRPSFGTDLATVPPETQHFIYKKTDGTWGVIVPVVADDYKCVLEGTPDGLSAKLFSWYDGLTDCESLAFVISEGNDPFVLTENCVEYALELLNNGCVSRRHRRYPEIFEYLGWCSWDAMPIGVHEAGILQKCEEFKEKKIPVKWAIFDDMWAEVGSFRAGMNREDYFKVHRSPLRDIEAGYDRFPNGLAHAISAVKEYDMEVGIWLPTTGYWNGLEKDSPADHLCKPYTIEAINGQIVGDWHEDKSFGYYNTIHRFYKSCGASFMKVDNQTMVRRFYKGMASVGQIAREYHRGLEASIGLNFDNTMINCMGMGAEDIWTRTYSSISRCSDDFKPEDRPWFTKHILQCTYNSILQGQFYWNDYDMWWTDDTQAIKNSLLRAVSGGPIYISDEIGRSRAEILKPLTFNDGRILRCERSGMPTKDCLTVDPETSDKPLKIQNIIKNSGVIATFNITREQHCVTGTVSSVDIPGLFGDRFAVYEHFTGEYTIVNAGEPIEFSLENIDDFRLYIFVPYINNFAAIGRIDKFIAPAAITQQIGENVTLYEDGIYAYIKNGKLIVEEK